MRKKHWIGGVAGVLALLLVSVVLITFLRDLGDSLGGGDSGPADVERPTRRNVRITPLDLRRSSLDDADASGGALPSSGGGEERPRVWGYVRNGAGAPIRRATVTAELRERGRSLGLGLLGSRPTDHSSSVAAVTDSEGHYQLVFDGIESIEVFAKAAGFAVSKVRVVRERRRVDFELTAAAKLRVTCLDPKGNPLKGAYVVAWRPGQREKGAHSSVKAMTDAKGVAVLEDLRPGVVQVDCMSSLFAAPSEETIVVLEAGKTAEVSVQFELGRRLVGRVTDKATGKPVLGATVAVDLGRIVHTTTKEDGTYLLPNVGVDSMSTSVYVWADRYAPDSAAFPTRGVLDFALTRGIAIAGKVSDSEGAPLAGVDVQAMFRGYRGDATVLDRGACVTDADGAFEIAPLRGDVPHSLFFFSEKTGRYVLDCRSARAGESRIDVGRVALPRPCSVRGRVVDAEGQGLGGVGVGLWGDNRKRLVVTTGGRGRPVGALRGLRERQVTDENGAFAFALLPPGEFELGISAGRFRRKTEWVTLTREEPDVEVVVDVGDVRSVRVTCVDVDGSPVPGLRVLAKPPGSVLGDRDAKGLSDGNGILVLENLERKDYELVIRSSQRYQPIGGTRIGRLQTDVRMVVRKTAEISGTVRPSGKFPIQGFFVVATWGDGERKVARTAPTGAFSFRVPEGEEIVLRVEGFGGATQGRNVVLKSLKVLAPAKGLVIPVVWE